MSALALCINGFGTGLVGAGLVPARIEFGTGLARLERADGFATGRDPQEARLERETGPVDGGLPLFPYDKALRNSSSSLIGAEHTKSRQT